MLRGVGLALSVAALAVPTVAARGGPAISFGRPASPGQAISPNWAFMASAAVDCGTAIATSACDHQATASNDAASVLIRPSLAATGDATFTVSTAIASVPEPATWGMMILGVGLVGGTLRRRIRRSEARFTERLRRIEAGEDEA